jgi:uncharacterized protein (DUF1778 family)
MKKSKRATRTKRAMVHIATRFKREDRELWREAAARTGESLSEVLRIALRKYCRELLLGSISDQNAA